MKCKLHTPFIRMRLSFKYVVFMIFVDCLNGFI